MGLKEALLYLKCLTMIALGCPPVLAVMALMYGLMGHDVKVRAREKAVEVNAPNPKYEVITECGEWVIKVRTDVGLDPFG